MPFRFGVPDATLVYVLEGSDGSLALIDPGWASDDGLEALRDGLTAIGRSLEDVGLVVVTHLHADHLGAAAAVRRATGARVAMHRLEVEALHREREDAVANDADIATWGLPDDLRSGVVEAWGSGRRIGLGRTAEPFADVLLEDGTCSPSRGAGSGRCGPRARHGALLLRRRGRGLLFTGDHVLPGSTPGSDSAVGRRRTRSRTTWPRSGAWTGTPTSRCVRSRVPLPGRRRARPDPGTAPRGTVTARGRGPRRAGGSHALRGRGTRAVQRRDRVHVGLPAGQRADADRLPRRTARPRRRDPPG
ncbi:MBL fold metallo-hydrolase [Curtobacterium flaccumfaciens]|nr:MBL fold metallo-hydrolase [Curtobacterium flaccumfaciens]